jgi:site-specific DNA-methyltransferase (adenine-specific)
MQTNVLYYGDNLEILRRYIPDASVDLIYLDPPFNSNRDYNVIFRDESGNRSDAQLLAFEDTWHWGPSAEHTYRYLTNTAYHEGRVPDKVSTIIAALRSGIGENQMMAYLVEMAVRLVELHRVLKPTGSLYLHCDATASHYLKMLLDTVFGPGNYRNEVIWHYAKYQMRQMRKFIKNSDRLLFYVKDAESEYVFNPQTVPLDKPKRYLRKQWSSELGRIVNFKDEQGHTVMDEYTDQRIDDVWDIPYIAAPSKERLGYPTQKPIKLLERVIAVSSNPGDVLLDPFCGCGTAVAAAQKMDRAWIGIDITYLSIAVMKARLKDSFGIDVPVIGQPTEVEGARQLAQGNDGRYQFQWWALNLIEARPLGGVEKKGADRGIDGRITFTIGPKGEMGQALVSVKSGHVNSSMIRDLKGTIEREGAQIGLFITPDEASREMELEATTAGFYTSPISGKDYPRIQILTIRELLEEHKKPMLPLLILPIYQQAERIPSKKAAEQKELFG